MKRIITSNNEENREQMQIGRREPEPRRSAKTPGRLMKNPRCRLLKKISETEAREIDERRLSEYVVARRSSASSTVLRAIGI
jgi:hypothetical protein